MSDDGGMTPDGSDGGTEGPAAPMSPMPPASPMPVARACPDGWVESMEGCLPFATEPSCAGAEAALPGESGCVSVGSPCPSGLFASPPSGDVIYVSAAATSVGDGSLASPYDRLWRAVAAASAGTTILLSKGEHVGNVELPSGVDVRGACAAETTLRAETADPSYPTLLVQAGEVEVSDLTLTGERPGVFAVGASARAVLRGVVVSDVPGLGILAQGGTIDAAEVIVRGVRTVGGAGGRGVDAIRDGTLVMSRSMVEGALGGGTLLSSGSSATLSDVLYRDPGPRAVTVQEGATVSLDRVAMLRVPDVALNGNNAGTVLAVRDLYIAGETGTESGGRAISVSEAATLDAEGVYVAHIAENAVFVTDADAAASVADARFTDIAGRALNVQRGATLDAARVVAADVRDVAVLASSGGAMTVLDVAVRGGGRGLRAQTGGSLMAARVSLREVVEDAVQSSNEGTVVVVEDLDVRGGTLGMTPARGAAAFSGSSLTVRRASMAGLGWAGVSVFDEATNALLEDVDIQDTQPYHDGTAGYGLAVLDGSLEADRVRISNAHTMGVGTAYGARVILRDVTVGGTQAEEATGLWGRAMSSQGPSDEVRVERGVFEESIAAGVFAGGESDFDLRDIVVRTTRRRDCGTGFCVEEGGVGVVSYYGASIRIESFLLTDNDIAGAQLGEGGELDFFDGVVSDQPIGVSIQTPGYDVNRLTREVRYQNNESNLDTDELPVPSESTSIEPTDEPPED